jgi:hypothetical protein
MFFSGIGVSDVVTTAHKLLLSGGTAWGAVAYILASSE